jgi:hypothetical protein
MAKIAIDVVAPECPLLTGERVDCFFSYVFACQSHGIALEWWAASPPKAASRHHQSIPSAVMNDQAVSRSSHLAPRYQILVRNQL